MFISQKSGIFIFENYLYFLFGRYSSSYTVMLCCRNYQMMDQQQLAASKSVLRSFAFHGRNFSAGGSVCIFRGCICK